VVAVREALAVAVAAATDREPCRAELRVQESGQLSCPGSEAQRRAQIREAARRE
jgi:hypothetical protein